MARKALLAAALSAILVGCSIKSPILLYESQRFENPKRLPIKAGLMNPVFEQKYNVSSITTLTLPIPFYTMKAGLPRKDEKLAVRDAVLLYIRDHNLFSFVYPQPFDKKDVDVLIDVRVQRFRLRNNSFYSSFMMIPFVNLLTLLGVPQEYFSCNMEMEFAVQTPDGSPVVRYKFEKSGGEFALIYNAPFGGYLWYRSIFRHTFLELMSDFQKAFEEDSDRILQAVEAFKRGG